VTTVRLRAADGTETLVTLPDPVVSPLGGGRVPPFPAFPDVTNTGLTGPVTPWTGSYSFMTNGQVVQNASFICTGAKPVFVGANNVTFRNCKFVYNDKLDANWTMVDNEGTGSTFESCDFNGIKLVARAIWGDGTSLTVRWCHIYNTGNAIENGVSPLLAEENYIHDIKTPAGADWHADGIQVWNGSSNVIIRHNTIILNEPGDSAVALTGSASAPTNNVWVTNNLCAGGGWTMASGYGPDVHYLNNHLSTQLFPKVGLFGPWYDDTQLGGGERRGNVIHETGASCNTNNL